MPQPSGISPCSSCPPSRFDSWKKADGIEVGSPEYYSKQYYTQGTRCWNGPARNVVVRPFRAAFIDRHLPTRPRAYSAPLDMRHRECPARRARAREVRVPVHCDHASTVLTCGWCGDEAGGVVVPSKLYLITALCCFSSFHNASYSVDHPTFTAGVFLQCNLLLQTCMMWSSAETLTLRLWSNRLAITKYGSDQLTTNTNKQRQIS